MTTSALALALTYFLVANPIGNSPVILSLVKHFDFERQKKIIFREAMISLLLAFFFQFFGEVFLGMLHVSDFALSITGGVVLFIIALQMIFHKPENPQEIHLKQEPFIVPIAIPLVSGPGLLTMIMITSRSGESSLTVSLGIAIAWIGVTAVLVGSPYLQRLLGKQGLAAMEQVMGMILGLIAVQMLVNGARLFAKTLP